MSDLHEEDGIYSSKTLGFIGNLYIKREDGNNDAHMVVYSVSSDIHIPEAFRREVRYEFTEYKDRHKLRKSRYDFQTHLVSFQCNYEHAKKLLELMIKVLGLRKVGTKMSVQINEFNRKISAASKAAKSAMKTPEQNLIELLNQIPEVTDEEFSTKIFTLIGKELLVLLWPNNVSDAFPESNRSIIVADNEGNMIIVNLSRIKAERKDALRTLLASSAKKVFLDGKETLIMFAKNNIDLGGEYFDIGLSHQLLTAGLKKDKASSKDLFLKHVKEDYINDLSLSEEHFGIDLKLIFTLYKRMEELLAQNKLDEAAKIEFGCLPVIVHIELSGIKFDDKSWDKVKGQFENVKTNYGKYLDPLTGRIHAKWNQMGTTTGRIISTEPNLQGVPRLPGLRSCFIPKPGYVFVIGDFSQEELRIAAEISEDATMREAYHQRKDLHKITAGIITGKAEEDITKDDRQSAKAVNFGLLYGMGPSGLISYAKKNYNIELSLEDAKKFNQRFLSTYSGLAKWQKQVREKASKETRTIMGRRRLWDADTKATERYNTPIQSTAVDILKTSLILLEEKIRGTDAKIVMTIHDEIVLEVLENEAEKYKKTLAESMAEGWNSIIKSVSVEVEVKICKSWSEK